MLLIDSIKQNYQNKLIKADNKLFIFHFIRKTEIQ